MRKVTRRYNPIQCWRERVAVVKRLWDVVLQVQFSIIFGSV